MPRGGGATMTLQSTILDLLRQRGAQSRPQIEAHLIEVGYAPSGASPTLACLKRTHCVRHVRRGGRHVTSLYALETNND
jgi:hypothetical protein